MGANSSFYINTDNVMKSVETFGKCATNLRSCATQIDEVKDGLDSSLATEIGPILAVLSERTRQHATDVTTLGVVLGAIVQTYRDCENNVIANMQQPGSGLGNSGNPKVVKLAAVSTPVTAAGAVNANNAAELNAIYDALPDWIKDALGEEWSQYFEFTDDGFFICTLTMDQLFAKAGLTDAMQTNVENWYLIGVYDPKKNPPGITYGAAVINRTITIDGEKKIAGSQLAFTAIDMNLIEKAITANKNGEPLDDDSIYAAIAPVLYADRPEYDYYKNPNEQLMKYFCEEGNDGSILLANLVVQDNLNTRFSAQSSGGTAVDGVFPYKYDDYCSQSRDAINSLIEKGICTMNPTTGEIKMTIKDPNNLSMDEYNALLMMTTDDPDVYAYIAENNAHAEACDVGFHKQSSIKSDCWPGENGKAGNNSSQYNPSGGSEHSYKDENGRFYKKAKKEHKDQFTN